MSDLNIVVVEGHLTKSAELSYWGDGTPYCSFSIANNESYKKPDGQYENIPSFIDCTLKGKYAETMAQYLQKGRKVTVTGRLKQSRWEKDGQKFSKIAIKVQELKLAPVANTESQQRYTSSAPQQSQQRPEEEVPDSELDFVPFNEAGEDIPF